MPISAGSYNVGATFLVNGTAYPYFTLEVDLNVYSMASIITVTAPIYPLTGTASAQTAPIDFAALVQKNPLTPISVSLSYEDASQPQKPSGPFTIEQGYIDEVRFHYHANMVEIVGRSQASLFQDTLVASPASKNQRGDQIVSKFFAKHGIPATVTQSPSGTYIGRGYTQNELQKAFRVRSEWDEMTAAALNDGYVLTLHNGKGFYGPPGVNTPTVQLDWGSDITECEVHHAGRRSHDISVTVFGQIDKTQQPIMAGYSSRGPSGGSTGSSGGNQGENYLFFSRAKDRNALRQQAKSTWLDLVKREFISYLTVVPDSTLLQTIANTGPNFLVQLGGCLPTANLLYHVKQVNVRVEAGDAQEPTAIVKLTCENHLPVQGAGAYI